MSSYRVAPIFVIRAAGVAFDHLDRLATPQTSAAARELLVRRKEFADAKDQVETLLRSGTHGLSEELFAAWRKAIRTGTMPPVADQASSAFAMCWDRARHQAAAESALKDALHQELERARKELHESSRTLLPPYLVFGAGEFRDRLSDLSDGAALPPRNARTRERERHLLLYLQRVCSKNDTFSEFGPSGWGTVSDAEEGLRFAADLKLTRTAFFERWAAHAVAAAINQDFEARMELAPRLNPTGRLEPDGFFLTETNDRILLDPETLAALRHCDGLTPAHALTLAPARLENLARQNVIRWEAEVPAMEPYAFNALADLVNRWREGEARARWTALLDPLSALPENFSRAAEVSARTNIMADGRDRLAKLGIAQQSAQRHLYSAANPIAEECFRSGEFVLSERLLQQFVSDAEPWIDLWRDTYAFVASRVAAGLRRFYESTPRQNGSVPLPAFLRHCAINQMPLTAHGCVVLAHRAFQELKVAFRKRIEDRAELEVLELTREDCHFVRNNFEYPKFDEYTFPSADLQIAARSAEAIRAGDYQWVLAELHPPPALLHQCFYWSCPDPDTLSAALASTALGRPNFHFGFAAADFTAHTTVRIFDALPELTYFVAPQRGKPKFRTLAPGDAEVYIDETGDVCVRKRDSHEHLGSFARAWLIPLGFHPFFFGRAPHMPRLRCGNVIVQRRSWTIGLGELPSGNFSGISTDLVVAVEHLRAEEGWPRHIYIRPTEQALRRSGAEGRDKDTKPVYIDLESYLSLEIFHRWLNKSGELEVTEMLPDPDHLCWHESDGRRTFELRTLIVPRS